MIKNITSLLILFFAFSRIRLLIDESIYIDFVILSAVTNSPDSSIIFSWLIVVIEIALAGLSIFKGGKIMILVVLFYGTSHLISLVEYFMLENYSHSVFTESMFVSISLRLIIVFGAFRIAYEEEVSESID